MIRASEARALPMSIAEDIMAYIEQNKRNNVPASNIVTGRVSIHASAISLRVPYLNPTPLATIVPVTPEDKTWVVLTGNPRTAAKPMVMVATNSEDAPCA
jgi:hypothetical protein